MEIANKPKHTLTNLDLSIQISLNGLSFCVLHKPTNTITFLKHINTDKKVTPFKILDLLKHAFVSETMLQNTFNKRGIVEVETNPELVENKAIQAFWKNYQSTLHKRRATFTKKLK